MFSPPIPQIPSTPAAPIPTSNTALEFTEAELLIVKKWLTLYSNAVKEEQYNLLKGKILPQLYLLNKDLPLDAWRDRKSVSTR